MRYFIYLFALIGLTSCKETTKETKEPEVQLSLAEKVAKAHGIDHWNEVKEIRFTFNVDRDTTHFERRWAWNTDAQQVTMMSNTDTVTYNRANVDSSLMRTDAGFVNDKFWLLLPYQLRWDADNFSYETEQQATAPISGDSLTKLTIVYGNEGGYTPGDAYDLYIGDDYMIREWTFRKGNQEEPSMSTTWEGYETFGDLKIATKHVNPAGGTTLYFTDVEVIME